MRNVLVIIVLVLCACKKEDNSTPHRSFYGKWHYQSAVFKQYTVSDGDTTFSRLDTLYYNGTDYIDFTQNGTALQFFADDQATDTLNFEEITPVFFRLDSLLCQATTITDSELQYHSLDFTYNETPLVTISQTFYYLKR
jgi:hypothetical protein